MTVNFDEAMYRWTQPNIELSPEANTSLTFNANASGWMNEQTFVANYDVSPDTWSWDDVAVSVASAADEAGNVHVPYSEQSVFNINIFPPLGVADMFVDDAFVVYPNPVAFGSEVNINTLSSNAKALKVYNLLGRLVLSQQIGGLKLVQIPTEALGEGEFIISVELEGGESQAKIIVTR
ncbi:T9SS type A sorting domain-containing protein [Salibacteraceae bacterium]|nr:T9SS type A sorting domain-containing protein [Salibacteraceae bacterium]MDB4105804.1 T9SS type A sorting domain-containing protein [Salibacteraceae bacterium]MDB9710140.1 T9SS type A sorting domain-containing protein [Salibacteraceae bacterium]